MDKRKAELYCSAHSPYIMNQRHTLATGAPTGVKQPVLVIAAPVRSEAPYLLEWLAYHRTLGIQAFILGDNGGDDGTSDLLIALDRLGIAKRLEWRERRYFQLSFNRQALEFSRLFADGLFLVDIDEFLRPTGPEPMAAVVQSWLADETIGAVALNWAIYGSSGHLTRTPGLVLERFTRRAPQDFAVNRHAKAFVRVANCAGPSESPHATTLSIGRYVDTCGTDVSWNTSTGFTSGITRTVIWDRLRVDHFVLKSREEFERKRRRGSALTNITEKQRMSEQYVALHDRNDVEDRVPDALVQCTKQEIARLEGLLAMASAAH
jgi:hypothetical protein